LKQFYESLAAEIYEDEVEQMIEPCENDGSDVILVDPQVGPIECDFNICRLCMTPLTNGKVEISEKIKSQFRCLVAGFELIDSSCYPRFICDECDESLLHIDKFRSKVIYSQDKIDNLITGKNFNISIRKFNFKSRSEVKLFDEIELDSTEIDESMTVFNKTKPTNQNSEQSIPENSSSYIGDDEDIPFYSEDDEIMPTPSSPNISIGSDISEIGSNSSDIAAMKNVIMQMHDMLKIQKMEINQLKTGESKALQLLEDDFLNENNNNQPSFTRILPIKNIVMLNKEELHLKQNSYQNNYVS
jgi:hypothetical protein